MLQKPLPTVVINLDRDADRYARLCAAFAPTRAFALERLPGVLGSTLPAVAVAALTGGQVAHPRGTLGCTLSHVAAWEHAARSRSAWTLVLEDDAVPAGVGRLFRIKLPEDADLVMITRRADMLRSPPKSAPRAVPLAEQAAARASRRPMARRAPGAEGYLVSRKGARILLEAVARDGFRGFVDWRLWRYGLGEEEIANLAESVFRGMLGKQPGSDSGPLCRAYALSPGLIKHPRGDSRRKVIDDAGVPGVS